MGTGKVSTGTPTRLRSFDPVRLADLEYRAWVGYYLRRWPQVLRASIGLVRVGFGMDWYRTMHASWLVLRATQLWAPYPDNNPKRALACMRRFYALVRLAHGEPSNPAKAAELEVEWWRVHREIQHEPGSTLDEPGRRASPALLLPVRRARGSGPAGRGTAGRGDGPVRSVGGAGLPARQPAAPARARGPSPRLVRPPRRRPPLTSPVTKDTFFAPGHSRVPEGRPLSRRVIAASLRAVPGMRARARCQAPGPVSRRVQVTVSQSCKRPGPSGACE